MSGLLQVMREDNPHALYPLTETSGTVARDESGAGRHGTYVSGYTLDTDSVLFRSVHLTGTDVAATGAVSFPNSNLATMAGTQASLEFWFYPTAAGGGWNVIGLTSGNGYGHPLNTTFLVSPTPNVFRFTTGSGPTAEVDIIHPNPLTLNQWNHIVVTFNGTASRSCVNGAFYNATASTRGAHGSNLMWLGWREGTGAQRGSAGRYAYLATYASTLSDARVLAHYLAGIRNGVVTGG